VFCISTSNEEKEKV